MIIRLGLIFIVDVETACTLQNASTCSDDANGNE